ncbi:MAG: hypothetical protein L0219_09335 [Phycisphaerales bacterium]|nr:hypothetical protein [Phycisphaerales bacterium]
MLDLSFRSYVLVALAQAIAVLSSAAWAGESVYLQPALANKGNSFSSQLNGFQRADNWTPDTSQAVTGIRWWGATSGTGEALSFTLRVYLDSGGVPTSLVDQFTIGSDFTKTPTGLIDLNGRDLFQYDAELPEGGFVPTSGTTYWLTLLNDQAGAGGPLWLWHQGSGGDSSHVFRDSPTGSWSAADGDMAFELFAAPSAKCPADFNQSGTVDITDLLIVISNWGTTGKSGGDANGDGLVDIGDLLAVIGAWGPCQ